MRVYELAKEYDYKAKYFVSMIQDFGVEITSHMSGLDQHQVDLIRTKMDIVDHTKEGKNSLKEEIVTEIKSERNVEFLDNLHIIGEPEGEDSSLETVTVELDEQLNPVDEMEDSSLETETIEEKNERRKNEIANETKKVFEREKGEGEQEVIIERPIGFFSWLKGLFS